MKGWGVGVVCMSGESVTVGMGSFFVGERFDRYLLDGFETEWML